MQVAHRRSCCQAHAIRRATPHARFVTSAGLSAALSRTHFSSASARRHQHVPPVAAAGGGGTSGSGTVPPPGGSGGSGGASGGSGDAQSHPMRPWTFFLAALLAVGGAMGFVKKGSAKSLGGGLSGAVILALAARSMTGAGAFGAARVAFGVTLLLGIFFVSRYSRSKKIFPAGVGAGVCLGYAMAFVFTGLA